jgi:hypothetical protein
MFSVKKALRKQSSERFVFWAAGNHPTTCMSSSAFELCLVLEVVSPLNFCFVVICGLSVKCSSP